MLKLILQHKLKEILLCNTFSQSLTVDGISLWNIFTLIGHTLILFSQAVFLQKWTTTLADILYCFLWLNFLWLLVSTWSFLDVSWFRFVAKSWHSKDPHMKLARSPVSLPLSYIRGCAQLWTSPRCSMVVNVPLLQSACTFCDNFEELS